MVKQIISKAVGIDLGTTNSAVAVMNPTDTDIIIHKHKTGSQTTPSCVWKDPKNGEIVVGMKAFQRIGSMPAPVQSIKRSMGHQVKVPLGDKVYTPEEISGFILHEEKKQIEEDLAALSNDSAAWIADRAIITVPAYFDQPQIEATRKAGELVGFEVIDLLHEPTAAACYYCWLRGIQDGTFLVYDFGGGTFDVAIIRSTEGLFEVLGIAGNNRLGGDDLDHVIAEDLRERLIAEGYALDLDLANSAEDQLRFTQLKFLAEGLKKALSNSLETIMRDQALRDKENNPIIIDMPFERKDIEKLMLPLINRTIPYCFDALEIAEKKAGIRLADIDGIILAGGSTHIPLVRAVVRQNLCSMPEDQVRKELIADARAEQPRAKCAELIYEKVDTLVALGAAIRASAVGGLVIYNPERTLQVTFRGVGLSGREKTHIGGEVKALDPNIDLTGASIHLSITGTSFEDETPLTNKDESLRKTEGAFGFRQIPLQVAFTNLLLFRVQDRNGIVLMGAERQVAQDTQSAAKPTGGSSQSAILSKPVILEVSREGKPYLKEIFVALEQIPQQKKFTFYHPGDTERIRIPIYQKKRKIQEIIVKVSPSLPKGTPIDLDVAIDALHLITVKGSIGEQTFDAVIAPPPERDMPTEEELKSLEKSFAEAKVFLPAGRRAVLEARFRTTWENLKNARNRGDKDQTIHDLEEIEGIIAETSQVKSTLEPPLATFMDFVQENYKLNREVATLAANHGQPHDHKEIAKAIDAQREYGENAFQEGNQKKYSDAIKQLEGIKNHLIGLGSALIKEPVDDTTPQEKAQQAVARCQHVTEKVERLVHASKNERYEDEVTKLKAELHTLSREAQRDPTTVRERAAQIHDRLKRIYDVMMGISSDAICYGLIEVPGSSGVLQNPPSFSTGTGYFPKRQIPTQRPDTLENVYFSLAAPRNVSPGFVFTLTVWAHLFHQRSDVKKYALEEIGHTDVVFASKGPSRVKRNTTFSVMLKIEGMDIENCEDRLEWAGEVANTTFMVKVPKNALSGPKAGKIQVFMNGLLVLRIDFTISVGENVSVVDFIPMTERRMKTAFISYSNADFNEVMKRIQGIQAGNRDLEIFFDKKNIRPGARWKDELRKSILKSDVFYLFWSKSASESKWVEKEWRCALKHRGIDYICPVPLISPERVPPPPELGDEIQFGDWTQAYMRGKCG